LGERGPGDGRTVYYRPKRVKAAGDVDPQSVFLLSSQKRNMKICIVSSCGGHLTEVRMLLPAYDQYPHVYVLNSKAILPVDMSDKTYFISHSERDWRFFLNLLEAWIILKKEKPDVILSAGAGPIVPFSVVARLFTRVKIIYIETITQIHKPSLTGRIMRFLAHKCLYQSPTLAVHFPRGEHGGPLV
jgi:beta-1,4-N-acetylglucosaminyltransferase